MQEKEYPYKVSACIITYNQAEYIGKAIEGALKQEVDFPYEIIIGDDCSTDGTRDILRNYKQQYPDLIKLNLQEQHDKEGIPGRRNNITNIRSAQGKYIAFCDGDDYWISPDKLQKQVDFMDANPEYALCFHDACFIDVMREEQYLLSEKIFSLRNSTAFTFKNLIRKEATIPSSSIFLRKKYLEPLPQWFWDVYFADRMLELIAAQHGPIRYMKDLKYMRLLNENGVSNDYESWLMFAKANKNDISIIRKQFKYHGAPISFKTEYYLHRSAVYFRQSNYKLMLQAIYKAIAENSQVIEMISRKILSKVRFTAYDYFKK